MDVSIAVIIGVVIVAGCAGVAIAKQVTRVGHSVSRTVDSVSSILSQVEQAQIEEHARPKSLAATTSLVMPQIKQDFPEFNLDEMKKRAANCVTQYLRGIDQMDASILDEGTPQLKEKLRLYISMLRDADQVEQYDQIKIHRTEITRYTKQGGRCIVSFQCSLQSKHSVTNRDGKIIKGSAQDWEQSRWQADLLYVQDVSQVDAADEMDLGLTCPNCGAPIKSLGEKTCSYCGAGIIEINLHAWNFCDVIEG